MAQMKIRGGVCEVTATARASTGCITVIIITMVSSACVTIYHYNGKKLPVWFLTAGLPSFAATLVSSRVRTAEYRRYVKSGISGGVSKAPHPAANIQETL